MYHEALCGMTFFFPKCCLDDAVHSLHILSTPGGCSTVFNDDWLWLYCALSMNPGSISGSLGAEGNDVINLEKQASLL